MADATSTLNNSGKYEDGGLDVGSLLGNLLTNAIGNTTSKDTNSTSSSNATGSTSQTGTSTQAQTGSSSQATTGSNTQNVTGSNSQSTNGTSSQNVFGSNTQNVNGTTTGSTTGTQTQQQTGQQTTRGSTAQDQTSRTTGTITTGGTRNFSSSTQNSADISKLLEQYGRAQAGISPEELAAIFNQGYKQAPNVMLAQSQALGARGGDNTAAAMGLNMLNRDLVDMAAQKKFQYSQLAGQLAGQIGDLTRSSSTSGSETTNQTQTQDLITRLLGNTTSNSVSDTLSNLVGSSTQDTTQKILQNILGTSDQTTNGTTSQNSTGTQQQSSTGTNTQNVLSNSTQNSTAATTNNSNTTQQQQQQLAEQQKINQNLNTSRLGGVAAGALGGTAGLAVLSALLKSGGGSGSILDAIKGGAGGLGNLLTSIFGGNGSSLDPALLERILPSLLGNGQDSALLDFLPQIIGKVDGTDYGNLSDLLKGIPGAVTDSSDVVGEVVGNGEDAGDWLGGLFGWADGGHVNGANATPNGVPDLNLLPTQLLQASSGNAGMINPAALLAGGAAGGGSSMGFDPSMLIDLFGGAFGSGSGKSNGPTVKLPGGYNGSGPEGGGSDGSFGGGSGNLDLSNWSNAGVPITDGSRQEDPNSAVDPDFGTAAGTQKINDPLSPMQSAAISLIGKLTGVPGLLLTAGKFLYNNASTNVRTINPVDYMNGLDLTNNTPDELTGGTQLPDSQAHQDLQNMDLDIPDNSAWADRIGRESGGGGGNSESYGDSGGGGGGDGGASSGGGDDDEGKYTVMAHADGGLIGTDHHRILNAFGISMGDGNVTMSHQAALALAASAQGGRGQSRAGMADGGMIHGPGTGISDSIPAQGPGGKPMRVANGEYIVPADVVAQLGPDFFDALSARYHTPAAQQRADGGMSDAC